MDSNWIPRHSPQGGPTWPDAGRFWRIIQDHRVSIFYTAPTALRALMKLAPKTAWKIGPDGRETETPLEDIVPGDRLRVRLYSNRRSRARTTRQHA